MNGVNKCNVNSRNSCTTTKGQLLARLKQSRTISIRVNWALKRLKTLTNLLAYASRRWSSSLSSFSWYPTAVANSGAFLSLQLQNSSKIAFSCASIALVYLSAMTKSKKVAPLSRKWENSLCLLGLCCLRWENYVKAENFEVVQWALTWKVSHRKFTCISRFPRTE